MAGPKLFVSYSWTSPDHEDWVVRLATDLRESGVDVILDKWDLKEGHDAHAFMEKMVTDSEIKKVILVCDRAYVEKADGRSGGVGTEAQIISGEIYQQQAQDKFVAVVKERDETGRPLVPAYYRSRIYIDLSDPGLFSENFEKLVRWAYDQPLHRKPALGTKPSFLEEPDRVFLSTSSRSRRAIELLRNKREHAMPATAEYLSLLSSELEKLRIVAEADPFDEAVVQSIESFLPYRNEAIEVVVNLALYSDGMEARTVLHRFFEQLIPYLDRPQHITKWREWDWDNFRFVIHELFLYTIAVLIRYERFESAASLMDAHYYVPARAERGRDVMISFHVFRQYMRSLEHRNERLQLRRLSLRADLLKERCKGVGIDFRYLMQADFVLFLRADLNNAGERWWPETLMYVDHDSGPFEVFARSRSMKYFDQAKILLGIDGREALKPLLQAFAADSRRIPHWGFDSFSPTHLVGLEELATKP